MANGGRGWFQRRKPQSDPVAPVPKQREPELTRIEAYEAQRRTDAAEAARSRATQDGQPDFDSLLRPAARSGPSGERPEGVSASPAQRDPRAGTARPEDEADRRWAPPDTAWRGRADLGASQATGVTSPRPETLQPTDSSAPADADDSRPDMETPARRVSGAESNGPPSAPRYDWDAATAAALSEDAEPQAAPTSHPLPHSDPDKLLEDIIREIVGDATAETVSSLHQPRPASRTEPQIPVVEDAGSESRTLTESNDSSESPPESSAPGPADDTLDGDVTPRVDGDRTDVAPGAGPESEYTSAESYAVGAGDEPSAVPGEVGVERAEPASHPYAAATSHAVAAGPLGSVSRETSESHGGTPLADQLADETRRRLALDQAVLPLPETTRVFTISNQKGGVGKTTSAVNLAAALARAGAHVLVVDLDPQGNASTALGVDHRSELQSVYEVLVSDLPIADVVQPSTEHENLDCVPATIHLAGAEIELVSLVAREQRLRRALDAHLAAMERPYDYVFIDCPPSLGLLTINAFVAAREVLIPIQCEYYALEGLSQLLSNIELIERHLNPELRLSTILLTMYDSRTNLAQQVAQEVRDHFPTQTLDTIIPRSVRVSEAPSYGQSVISYDFASTGSLSYREAAAEIALRGTRNASEEKESD